MIKVAKGEFVFWRATRSRKSGIWLACHDLKSRTKRILCTCESVYPSVFIVVGVVLLPSLRFEAESCSVLCDSAFNLVGGSQRKLRVDLDRDVQRRVGVAGQEGDNFVSDLHETHPGSGWRNLSRAVE